MCREVGESWELDVPELGGKVPLDIVCKPAPSPSSVERTENEGQVIRTLNQIRKFRLLQLSNTSLVRPGLSGTVDPYSGLSAFSSPLAPVSCAVRRSSEVSLLGLARFGRHPRSLSVDQEIHDWYFLPRRRRLGRAGLVMKRCILKAFIKIEGVRSENVGLTET